MLAINNCTIGSYSCPVLNTVCNFTGPATYNCICAPGNVGNSTLCEVNNCANGNNTCPGFTTCVFTGSFQYNCTCNPGYYDNGTGCAGGSSANLFTLCHWFKPRFPFLLDYNECLGQNGGNTCLGVYGPCVNTPGSYTCDCNPSTYFNGVTCTGIFIFHFSSSFFFLLFSLSLFHPRTSVGQPLEDTDQAALVAFWFGVANPSPLGWNTNYSLCGQFGVICISQPPGYSVLEL